MNANQRKQEILELLQEDATLSAARLSERFQVSVVTIRNDLRSLEAEGLLSRSHGGAGAAFHARILRNQSTHADTKKRIARAAADLVKDGDRLMITSGTTCAMVVKYLLGKKDVHIVTNSSLILNYARINPSVTVTMVGGEFRPEIEAFVGPIALKTMAKFHVDLAFIGADGFTVEHGITADLVESEEIAELMVAHARKSVVVADSSKYGKAGFAHILPLESLDVLITDSGLDAKVQARLRKSGLELIVV
jgi:DeoR family galactitol utilization operon repressor